MYIHRRFVVRSGYGNGEDHTIKLESNISKRTKILKKNKKKSGVLKLSKQASFSSSFFLNSQKIAQPRASAFSLAWGWGWGKTWEQG